MDAPGHTIGYTTTTAPMAGVQPPDSCQLATPLFSPHAFEDENKENKPETNMIPPKTGIACSPRLPG